VAHDDLPSSLAIQRLTLPPRPAVSGSESNGGITAELALTTPALPIGRRGGIGADDPNLGGPHRGRNNRQSPRGATDHTSRPTAVSPEAYGAQGSEVDAAIVVDPVDQVAMSRLGDCGGAAASGDLSHFGRLTRADAGPDAGGHRAGDDRPTIRCSTPRLQKRRSAWGMTAADQQRLRRPPMAADLDSTRRWADGRLADWDRRLSGQS
jgi:hypothetical protein